VRLFLIFHKKYESGKIKKIEIAERSFPSGEGNEGCLRWKWQ